MKKLKVSFIIAAYNEEFFIKECIESCLNQKYSNIEICVTDDGSNDNTWRILEGLAVDSRIKINKFKKNKGKVAAFNSSFSMATGNYIAIIGADDVNFPDRITLQVRHIEETQADLVWGGFEIVDESLNKLSTGLFYTPTKVTTDSILEKNVVTGGTVLMNQNLALSLFPLPEKLAFEDWWIAYKATTYGSLSYSKHVLMKYRQHTNNAAGGSDKNTVDQLQKNFKRHLKFYDEVKIDVKEKFNGHRQTELLRIIEGAVAYRRICLESQLFERFNLLIKNSGSLFLLSFPMFVKTIVIAFLGISFFIRIKALLKTV